MSLARFKHPIVEVDASVVVRAAARTMRDRGVGALLVTRGGRPIGIVTDRDLVVRALASGCSVDDASVSDFVTYDPITVHERDGIATVVALIRTHGVRRFPIVDDAGRTVGIVTADDLLSELGKQLGELCEGIENSVDSSEAR